MSAKGHMIRVGRLEIYAEVEGEGSLALVFIHYWGGSRRTWSEVIARLAPAPPTPLHAPDALRYGCMTRPLVRDAPGVPKARYEHELTINEVIERQRRKRMES